MVAYQRGRYAEAVAPLERAVAQRPGEPSYRANLAAAYRACGRLEDAIAAWEGALALEPADAAELRPRLALAHFDRGAALQDEADPERALVHYERATLLDPSLAEAFCNLGIVCRELGRLDAAAAAFERAVSLRPEFAPATYYLGVVEKERGRPAAAEQRLRETLRIDPGYLEPYRTLGLLLTGSGRTAEAREIFEAWLEREPGHPIARHYLAACSPGGTPERASDAYLRAEFDGFAGGYDENLAGLGYRGPERVARLLAKRGGGTREWRVLDAGCGTGLCGPLLREHASELVGVDLSPAMLALAKERGVYDELVEAELCAFLRGSPSAWDWIVAADTLIYFGPLDGVFAAAAAALRPGGSFVFTLEALAGEAEGGDHRLQPTGRYAHAEPYVRRALAAAGFRITHLSREALRQELDRPVPGFLIAAQPE